MSEQANQVAGLARDKLLEAMSITEEEVDSSLAAALIREVPSLTEEQAMAVLKSQWLINAQEGAVVGSRLMDMILGQEG